MARAYKNFWSLNTDEAVVAGILRDTLHKKAEVFMPVNAQLRDVDLILMNIKNKKALKIQVKGSRAYEPQKHEITKYGAGSAGWFWFKKDLIRKSMTDYFIFLVYVLEENKKTGRRIIKSHTLTIPTEKLNGLCKKYKKVDKSDRYNFFFWINPVDKKSFEFRDKIYDTTKYLDKKGFELLNKYLGNRL